jgi:hypothetical protein
MMWALGWIVGLDRGNPDGRDGEGQDRTGHNSLRQKTLPRLVLALRKPFWVTGGRSALEASPGVPL